MREPGDRRRGLQHGWRRGRLSLPSLRLPSRSGRRGGDRQSGASAVELAIVAPALLLLIFFSIQAGLYYYGRVVAQHAAREGVSVLRLAQDEERAAEVKAQLEDNVAGYAANIGRETLLAPLVDSGYDDPEPGRVWVSVEGQVISLVPGLDLTVTQRVDGTVERFTRDDRPR